jgi:hypothetical protein
MRAAEAEAKAQQDASATKPKDSNSQVEPQGSVVTDPDVNDTLPAVINIYNLVAIKMKTDIVIESSAVILSN